MKNRFLKKYIIFNSLFSVITENQIRSMSKYPIYAKLKEIFSSKVLPDHNKLNESFAESPLPPIFLQLYEARRLHIQSSSSAKRMDYMHILLQLTFYTLVRNEFKENRQKLKIPKQALAEKLAVPLYFLTYFYDTFTEKSQKFNSVTTSKETVLAHYIIVLFLHFFDQKLSVPFIRDQLLIDQER